MSLSLYFLSLVQLRREREKATLVGTWHPTRLNHDNYEVLLPYTEVLTVYLKLKPIQFLTFPVQNKMYYSLSSKPKSSQSILIFPV